MHLRILDVRVRLGQTYDISSNPSNPGNPSNPSNPAPDIPELDEGYAFLADALGKLLKTADGYYLAVINP